MTDRSPAVDLGSRRPWDPRAGASTVTEAHPDRAPLRWLSALHGSSARVELALHAIEALEGSGPLIPRTLSGLAPLAPGSEKLLSAVLTGLCRSGIIESSRGAGGGYWRVRSLADITVLEVVDAVNGPGFRAPPLLASVGRGALDSVWCSVVADVRALLQSQSLADLLAGERAPATSD